MKRIIVFFLLVAISVGLFALDGVVVDVLGKVERQQDGSWISLKKGDILEPGDIVSTGFKSEAVIDIGQSTIKVKALTRLTVEQLYEKNQNHVSSVYLDVGAISADVKPVENKRVGFTVKTPAVTASVRGTAGVVYAYGRVDSVRGCWAISAPRPKQIDKNRGDAEEAIAKRKAEQEALKAEQEAREKAEAMEGALEAAAEEAGEAVEKAVEEAGEIIEEVVEDVKDAIEEAVNKAEGDGDKSGKQKEDKTSGTAIPEVPAESALPPAPTGDSEIKGISDDLELEQMLTQYKTSREVFVYAGETANVRPGTNIITTPAENKAKEANDTGSAADLNDREADGPVIDVPLVQTGSISVAPAIQTGNVNIKIEVKPEQP